MFSLCTYYLTLDAGRFPVLPILFRVIAEEVKFRQRLRPRQRPCSSSTHEASATETGNTCTCIAWRKSFHFVHRHRDCSRKKHVNHVIWFPSTVVVHFCSSGGERQTQYYRLESCPSLLLKCDGEHVHRIAGNTRCIFRYALTASQSLVLRCSPIIGPAAAWLLW